MNNDAFNSRLPAEAVDFPAAHSMDTSWFAVDEDGHVALLESGEDGAVPKGVQDHGFDIWESLCVGAGELMWMAGARGTHLYNATSDPYLLNHPIELLMFLQRTPTFDPVAAPANRIRS